MAPGSVVEGPGGGGPAAKAAGAEGLVRRDGRLLNTSGPAAGIAWLH
jgi:hypothetical protein